MRFVFYPAASNGYGIRMYDIVTSCDVRASRTYFFSYEAHEYRFISDTF